MGRSDIRLRRQMSSGRVARHRNYGEIMARHERGIKMRRIILVLVYFLIITIMVLVFVVVKRFEKKTAEKKTSAIEYKMNQQT